MQQGSPASGASTQAEQHLRAQLELLQSHDTDSSSVSAASSAREPRGPPSRPPNGYGVPASTSQDVARPVSVKPDVESHIHPDLRAPSSHAPTLNMMPMASTSRHSPGAATSPPGAPLAPARSPSIHADESESYIDGRKAKRELSQSKRAAQNRAAQRAFRQRKEGYIKKLEQQVREYAELEQSYKDMQSENYALREYVSHLRSRLTDVQIEVPPPPPNVNLAQLLVAPPPPTGATEQQPNSLGVGVSVGVGASLETVAQAVVGLAAHPQRQQSYPSPPFKQEQAEQDTQMIDEINRQLNPAQGVGSA